MALSAVVLSSTLFGATFASWAVTDNAKQTNIRVSPFVPGKKRVNYYTPKEDGSGYELDSFELVDDGGTLADVPTPESIPNYTFEKWSTSSALDDSFNTSTVITQTYDLYAAYYGYRVKGSSDTDYTVLPKTTGSVTKYNLNNTTTSTSFSYSYALLGTESTKSGYYFASSHLTGSNITVSKHYFATSISADIETKSSKYTDTNYKVYFNPSGTTNNKIYLARTVLLQMKNQYQPSPFLHMWNAENTSVTTSWPGVEMDYLGTRSDYGENKEIYMKDVDASRVNRIIFNDNNGKQTPDITIPNNTNNIVWLNSGYADYAADHWFTLSPSETLNS